MFMARLTAYAFNGILARTSLEARPSNPPLTAKNKRSKKVSKIRHLLFLDSMAQIYLQT